MKQNIEGLTWNEAGSVGLSGSLLRLSDAIDRRFVAMAASFAAEPEWYAPLLAAADLRRIDYFSSFPHLATFPVSMDGETGNLREFAATNGSESTGPLHLGRLAPASAVLAPAACYAVYIARANSSHAQSHRVTVRGLCFRTEHSFEPLVRQPAFSMREVVHLGTAASVEAFLEEARESVLAIARDWQIPVSIAAAADPFFDPARSPKYLHARLFPSKQELLDQSLALASFNNHRNFFGEAFAITSNGAPVHTACVAFGIDRWTFAMVRRYGADPAGWPIEVEAQ